MPYSCLPQPLDSPTSCSPRPVIPIDRWADHDAPAEHAIDGVEAVFRRHDADSSGDIDRTELRAALNDLGLFVDTAEAGQVLDKYDADGSGRLQWPIFRRLVVELKAFQSARRGGDDVGD